MTPLIVRRGEEGLLSSLLAIPPRPVIVLNYDTLDCKKGGRGIILSSLLAIPPRPVIVLNYDTLDCEKGGRWIAYNVFTTFSKVYVYVSIVTVDLVACVR